MTNTQFFDDLITVTAMIDSNGGTVPKTLRWKDQDYTLTATGRQWESEEGRHILVETGGGERFEIQLSRTDLLWRLKQAWLIDFVV